MTSQLIGESPFQRAARSAAGANEDGYWEAYNKGMQATERNDRLRDEVIEGWAALEAEARAIKPKRPLNLAARAAYANRTAKTPKERRLADLMAFVAKYREGNPGIVIFPAWLSEGGRKRLLDIANRRREAE